MEHIEGKNMHEYLNDVGPPKFTQLPYIQNIGIQILEGIEYFHSISITHQDITPHNIMFDKWYKKIKLIDLSRMVRLDQQQVFKF